MGGECQHAFVIRACGVAGEMRSCRRTLEMRAVAYDDLAGVSTDGIGGGADVVADKGGSGNGNRYGGMVDRNGGSGCECRDGEIGVSEVVRSSSEEQGGGGRAEQEGAEAGDNLRAEDQEDTAEQCREGDGGEGVFTKRAASDCGQEHRLFFEMKH
ncbi:hypothetical protein AYI70_g6047 [Smittium culicis]|uniref:Uncharacterized protein n=1 Tax=Smittium culicis TaxID=133412 RepID=A0A1R1XDR5_9FUNG|nr:hypothetical protein AYI70_g8928 [Smittium culicis]OMJ17325.1 hypothetical protein AYI70_g6047 [Smittium culicis]